MSVEGGMSFSGGAVGIAAGPAIGASIGPSVSAPAAVSMGGGEIGMNAISANLANFLNTDAIQASPLINLTSQVHPYSGQSAMRNESLVDTSLPVSPYAQTPNIDAFTNGENTKTDFSVDQLMSLPSVDISSAVNEGPVSVDLSDGEWSVIANAQVDSAVVADEVIDQISTDQIVEAMTLDKVTESMTVSDADVANLAEDAVNQVSMDQAVEEATNIDEAVEIFMDQESQALREVVADKSTKALEETALADRATELFTQTGVYEGDEAKSRVAEIINQNIKSDTQLKSDVGRIVEEHVVQATDEISAEADKETTKQLGKVEIVEDLGEEQVEEQELPQESAQRRERGAKGQVQADEEERELEDKEKESLGKKNYQQPPYELRVPVVDENAQENRAKTVKEAFSDAFEKVRSFGSEEIDGKVAADALLKKHSHKSMLLSQIGKETAPDGSLVEAAKQISSLKTKDMSLGEESTLINQANAILAGNRPVVINPSGNQVSKQEVGKVLNGVSGSLVATQ